MWKKLSPKENVEGASTVLKGSVKAPKGFFRGQTQGCKTERAQPPRVFAAEGLPEENPEGAICTTGLTGILW